MLIYILAFRVVSFRQSVHKNLHNILSLHSSGRSKFIFFIRPYVMTLSLYATIPSLTNLNSVFVLLYSKYYSQQFTSEHL